VHSQTGYHNHTCLVGRSGNVHLLSESPVLGVPAGGFTITPWGRHTMGEAVTVS
jgi:hypothetical protein